MPCSEGFSVLSRCCTENGDTYASVASAADIVGVGGRFEAATRNVQLLRWVEGRVHVRLVMVTYWYR